MINTLFLLLVVYQLKHYLADYPLQTPYMLGKFKPGWDWVKPLLAHAGVHGLFTLLIATAVNPSMWWLAVLDFVIHFTMDRIKASPNLMGRWKALSANDFMRLHSDRGHAISESQFQASLRSNMLFWWALGIDQMVHHLTHYLIIFLLLL